MEFQADSIQLPEDNTELVADDELIAFAHAFHPDRMILVGGVKVGSNTRWAVRPTGEWERVKDEYRDFIVQGDSIKFSDTVGIVKRRGRQIAKGE